jgi:hypothetical protein
MGFPPRGYGTRAFFPVDRPQLGFPVWAMRVMGKDDHAGDIREIRACHRNSGSGGSLGFADPEAGVAYAYITSKMGAIVTGDPRDVALRDVLYSII